MISEERLQFIAHAPKSCAADLPTLSEAVDIACAYIALRALVLASRPALEFGAYCIERHTYLDNHVDAAQLLTLSAYGQSTGEK